MIRGAATSGRSTIWRRSRLGLLQDGGRSACRMWPISASARRGAGITDLDGEGEAVGGIVVMRYGNNALEP